METGYHIGDHARSSHRAPFGSFSGGLDHDGDDTRSLSSEPGAITNEGDFEPHTMMSRAHEARNSRVLATSVIGATRVDVIGAQYRRASELDTLQSISTSISEDLSQKDKVEARQFSALMARPPRPASTGASEKDTRVHVSPPPPPRVGRPSLDRLHTFPQSTDMLTQDKEQLGPFRLNPPPHATTLGDASPVQQKSRKRPRSELHDRSMALQEDLRDLDVHELEDLIEKLDQRAKQLGSIRASIQKPCNYLVLYRITASDRTPVMPGVPGVPVNPPMSLYFDPPQWTSGETGSGVLRSQLPVTNFDLYLEKNKEIAFVVYKTYTLPQTASDSHEKRSRCSISISQDMTDAIVDESIEPVDEALVSAIVALLEAQDEYASILGNFRETSELEAPYLFVFHQRNEWGRVRQLLPESSHQQMAMLWNYIIQSHGAEYTAADASMSNGLITIGLLKYLFKPGQLLLQSQDDEIQGWICADWPRAARRAEKASQRQDNLIGAIKLEKLELAESSPKWKLSAWHWDFDGNFHRRKATLPVSIKSETNEESKIPINTLSIFPLKYASEDSFKRIQIRGRNFWKCRKRGLVSYKEDADTNDSNLTEERYMIDLKTYQILHPDDVSQRSNRQGIRGYTLPRKAMDNKDPPDENFEFLLPAKIKGFNLRTKKWLNLVADRISDIKWNKEAFSKVVIERKAKNLIRALVSNQLESEKNTDLIEGKGNGLILLLHGGPGTGKTLTAESVAEIAEKPLYRVTCGDVGTKAEDVEKYLESVLYVGKLWGCVVLLDEADIFLQQRNLEDLQRNALVSVFLRVLEYYEGILVLTSNRVGTFDEAFKSRIQLALHYPALGPYQRLRIWENFFDRLDKMEDELIDLADLRDHLPDLQEEEMNGRQIRNAITTARQYAKWQNATLTYHHLKDVIEISGRFDKYLTKLHGGLTEGQLAEDEGLRLGGED